MTESEWLSSREPQPMLDHLTHVVDFVPDADGNHRRDYPMVSQRKLWRWVVAMTMYNQQQYRSHWWVDQFDTHMAGEKFPPQMNPIIVADKWCKVPFDFPGDMPLAARAWALRDIVLNPFRPAPTLHYSAGLHDHVWDIASVAYDETLPDGTIDPFHLGVLSDALEEAGCVGPCRYCGDSGTKVDFDATLNFIKSPGGTELLRDGIIRVPTMKCLRCDKMTHPVIEHLRSPGPHYRGMWSLDIVLGKA